MTATQLSLQPNGGASTELVCRPLVTMAARGFDKVCLLRMQDTAFRYAAQSLQNNRNAAQAGMSLLEIVDQRLGGVGRADADVSPGHLAAYMSAKAFYGQLRPRDAMFDVAVLTAAAPIAGSDTTPRLDWLAHTLVRLQQDADRLASTTPMFATEIAAQVRRTVAKRAEYEGLGQAMRSVMTRAASAADEDAANVDEYSYPSNS